MSQPSGSRQAAVGFGPGSLAGLRPVAGGVTAPDGFSAGGITAGLKPSGRPDLALVAAGQAAVAAAVVTDNRVKAAPCHVCERNVADGRARAVVINSGNANACTGSAGLHDAETMTETVAAELGCGPADVLVCSTGVIGARLDMEAISAGIPAVVSDLAPDGGGRAAEAILTTDTVNKQSAYRATDDTGSCVVGGMAKGAGMIEPSMATMIAVITTDAPLSVPVARSITRQVVNATFNRISVDACGSTNDTVVVLANGTASSPPNLGTFRRGLEAVCADLARAVVDDGEGTTKVAEIRVVGARSEHDAERLGRAVAGSVLFRAALHGADPNWGRVLAAMGAAGVDFDPGQVHVAFGPPGHDGGSSADTNGQFLGSRADDITVCRFGAATAFDAARASVILSKPRIVVTIDLGQSDGAATVLTADISPEYVRFNAAYTT